MVRYLLSHPAHRPITLDHLLDHRHLQAMLSLLVLLDHLPILQRLCTHLVHHLTILDHLLDHLRLLATLSLLDMVRCSILDME